MADGTLEADGPTAADLAEVRACLLRWPEPGSCCAAFCGAGLRAVSGSDCLACLAEAQAAPGP